MAFWNGVFYRRFRRMSFIYYVLNGPFSRGIKTKNIISVLLLQTEHVFFQHIYRRKKISEDGWNLLLSVWGWKNFRTDKVCQKKVGTIKYVQKGEELSKGIVVFLFLVEFTYVLSRAARRGTLVIDGYRWL